MITYYVSAPICRDCKLKSHCTVGVNRRIRRWEHEDVLDDIEQKLNAMPEAIKVRAQTVEHPFGTLKLWMGARHFLMKRLENVRTEMSLHVLAYNLKRMMSIFGVSKLMELIKEWSGRTISGFITASERRLQRFSLRSREIPALNYLLPKQRTVSYTLSY